MNKPNNYEETKVSNNVGNGKVRLGGHIAKILTCEELTSKTGKPMIKVTFDFDKADDQAGYFKKLFEDKDLEKWPFNGSKWIMAEDIDGNTNRDFKSFISAYEDSNNAQAVWGENFCKQFIGKRIGVCYGEEESYYNDALTTRINPRYFFNIDRIEDITAPKKKEAKNAPAPTTGTSDFMPMGTISDDELPFN